ncbi:DUF975 family protein [Lactobacillus salsicarnum]|uniref:DUF975 family protein n=1 Tax=Companilactobacillus mishanensis TaxID=2486008 RepID=A0A5P0ZHX2_9LACO|nr:DUF975 family protein [Companilactobacillus mishanensis]
MDTIINRAEIKKEVQSLLEGNWKKGILLTLVPLILGIIFLVTLTFVQPNSVSPSSPEFGYVGFGYSLGQSVHGAWTILMFLLVFVFSALIMLLQNSILFTGLDWIRNPEMSFNPVKSSFSCFKKTSWWQLVIIMFFQTMFVIFWSILLIIPGIIKMFSYSQAFFLYKDVQGRGEDEAKKYSLISYITMSRRLMRGHKWEYFVLNLSFIGWFILGNMSSGIGYIWILPYYGITYSNYYNKLIAQHPEVFDSEK